MVGQGCVSVPSVGSPGGGLYANRISPPLCLELRNPTLCYLNIALFFLFFGIDLLQTPPWSLPYAQLQPRSATAEQSARFGAHSESECRALQAVFSATMFQLVGRLFFTDCRCAESQDGPKTYEELFATLDANKDGKVDVSELKAGLAAMGIKSGKGAAQVGSKKEAAGFKGPCLDQILWELFRSAFQTVGITNYTGSSLDFSLQMF